MTPIDPFERRIPDQLLELAAERTPDYLDDLFARTAATRQRPAWTFPERWLPMTITLRRPTRAPPLRLLAVGLALLLALLAALALAPILSSPRPAPAVVVMPRNGLIAFHSDDRHVRWLDPATGANDPFLLGDPAIGRLAFSPDGSRLAFMNTHGDGSDDLRVLTIGSEGDPDALALDPFQDVRVLRWSPDGSRLLLVSSFDDQWAASVVTLGAGAGAAAVTLDVNMAVDWADWASEASLVIKGTTSDGVPQLYTLGLTDPLRPEAVLAVDVTTPLFAEWGASEYLWDPRVSPDGSSILYSTVVDRLPSMAAGTQNARARLVRADGSDDRLFEIAPDSHYETAAGWSPDGGRVAIAMENDGRRLAIASIDDPADALIVGPDLAIGAGVVWAPDGTSLFTWGEAGQAALVDATTGAITPVGALVGGDSAWRPIS